MDVAWFIALILLTALALILLGVWIGSRDDED
jgi:hypothetical protein